MNSRWKQNARIISAIVNCLLIGTLMFVYFTDDESPFAPPSPKVYEQRCLKCGAVWSIQPADGGIPEPTTEWCFHDGNLCEEGLAITIKCIQSEDNSEFITHCLTCEGCRCTFTPEQWKEIQNKEASE